MVSEMTKEEDYLIYGIRSTNGSSIKIGSSTNVAKRLASLQTGNPEPLEVAFTFPGSRDIEREIHTRLIPFRYKRVYLFRAGEWYHDVPEVRKIISGFESLTRYHDFEKKEARSKDWDKTDIMNDLVGHFQAAFSKATNAYEFFFEVFLDSLLAKQTSRMRKRGHELTRDDVGNLRIELNKAIRFIIESR